MNLLHISDVSVASMAPTASVGNFPVKSPSATWISDQNQGTWPNPRFPSSPSRNLPVTNLASRLEGVGGRLELGLGGLVLASPGNVPAVVRTSGI